MRCSETSARNPRPSRSRRSAREGRPAPPCRASQVLYAEVPRSEIALYRFLLEGYDNLAVMSVIDRYRAVIKLRCSPDAQQELREFLVAQGARIVEVPGLLDELAAQ